MYKILPENIVTIVPEEGREFFHGFMEVGVHPCDFYAGVERPESLVKAWAALRDAFRTKTGMQLTSGFSRRGTPINVVIPDKCNDPRWMTYLVEAD